MKPIEMSRGSHYGSDYWVCYSHKLKRTVHMYSMLEYWNFISLEMNPKVEYFCEQPVCIEMSDEKSGKTRKSVFDFWVIYVDGREEFQEQYKRELSGNSEKALRSQKQIELQRKWCSGKNKNYVVRTEGELQLGEFYISNLEQLHHYLLRGSVFNLKNEEKLVNELYRGHLTINEIISKGLISSNELMSLLALEYYKGAIDINLLNRPIDGRTEVRLCETKNLA